MLTASEFRKDLDDDPGDPPREIGQVAQLMCCEQDVACRCLGMDFEDQPFPI